MQAFHIMNIFCSSLIQSFLFIKEQTIKNDNDTVYTIINDRQHLRTQLSNDDFEFREKLLINNETKFIKFLSQHSFLQQLLHVYKIVIDRRIMNFERKSLK